MSRHRPSAPRLLSSALVDLLRAHRPPAVTTQAEIWICLTPPVAAAIARVAAGRTGSLETYRNHPAHAATRRATRVSTSTASQWRRDAWQAADEGLIPVADALLLSAQIDAPSAA